jgi:MFS family permease
MSTAIKEFNKSKMIIAGVLAILSYMVISCIPLASLAVLLPYITKEMNLTAQQAASFSAGVNLGIACLVFVTGVIMDKISTRLLMCIFGIGAALMVILRAFPTDYAFFYVLFPLFGVFLAVISPGCNKMIALWFPKKYLFAMNALIIAGGATAFVIGLNFTLPIANALGGWRNFFIAFGVVMAVLAVLWMILLPDRSSKDAELNKDIDIKNAEETKFWQNMKNVLSSSKVWLLCLSEFFFAGVISASTSLGTYAIYAYWGGQLTVQQSASIASTGNLGSLIGYIILPTILTKFFPKVDKTWPILASMVVSGVLWSAGYWGLKSVPWMIFCFAFGAFWNGFGFAGPRTILMELPEVAGLRAGTALGVFNTISRVGGVLIISFAGYLAVALKGFDNAMRLTYLLALLGAVCLIIFKIIVTNEQKKAAVAAASQN